MVTDSIANASIPLPAKDFSKKKRGNRTAKLKQCKLDARREQWLSQVKKKGCKEEEGGQSVPVSKIAIENLEVKPRAEVVQNYSDSDSPSNSPSSHASSILGSNASGTNFTASSSSGSSSSGGGSCSGSVSGEDEEDADEDGCLDDWEAVADALAASDDKQEKDNKPKVELHLEKIVSIAPLDDSTKRAVVSPKLKEDEHVDKVQRAPPGNRAWKADDAFRPQSLPNLSKQMSLPSGRHFGCGGGGVWVRKNVVSAPSSCPICCEDLDSTDSSFLPCGCGFRLCLFCHKRILEEDGRCPGCRKPYEYEAVKGEATVDGGSMTFRLARSCSMITRS